MDVPHNIMLFGFPRSNKTAIGQRLVRDFNTYFLGETSLQHVDFITTASQLKDKGLSAELPDVWKAVQEQARIAYQNGACILYETSLPQRYPRTSAIKSFARYNPRPWVMYQIVANEQEIIDFNQSIGRPLRSKTRSLLRRHTKIFHPPSLEEGFDDIIRLDIEGYRIEEGR